MQAALLALAAMSGAGMAQEATTDWGQVNQVTVQPQSPYEDTLVRVAVDGEKTNSCYRFDADSSREEQRVLVDLQVSEADIARCSQVSMPFSVAETIGHLPAGEYQLEIRVDGNPVNESSFSVTEEPAPPESSVDSQDSPALPPADSNQ